MCMHRRTYIHTQIHHTTRERKNERGEGEKKERRKKEGKKGGTEERREGGKDLQKSIIKN